MSDAPKTFDYRGRVESTDPADYHWPEAFEKYNDENPIMLAELRRRAMEYSSAGRKHLSIRMLAEVARFFVDIATPGEESEYKLPSAFIPFYGRLVLAQEPNLGGDFFQLRLAVRTGCDQWARANDLPYSFRYGKILEKLENGDDDSSNAG